MAKKAATRKEYWEKGDQRREATQDMYNYFLHPLRR
jgi:hypothetical protein